MRPFTTLNLGLKKISRPTLQKKLPISSRSKMYCLSYKTQTECSKTKKVRTDNYNFGM
jgi:hypothetical protein